ncbi:hypothetical protein L218DRAFT_172288 [Marasmius fiardii PR-910]|nr:hypothetical protein L218DRAFT_172288 [Marasmius fiardii PR-910]
MLISRQDSTMNLNAVRDPATFKILKLVQDRASTVSNQSLFVTTCPLEGRGSFIRNFESNLGNTLADAVKAYYDVDVAFVNSGSIRCDRVNEAGVLTVRDAIDILPFDNALLVKRVPTANLLDALENSVSDARTDGRFLQLSGMSVCVDLDRPEGSRVLSIRLDSLPGKVITHSSTEAELHFTIPVTMTLFIGDGFDGFLCLRDNEESKVRTVVGFEGAMSDTGLLLQIFRDKDKDLDDEGLKRARQAIVVGNQSNLQMINTCVEERIVFSYRY